MKITKDSEGKLIIDFVGYPKILIDKDIEPSNTCLIQSLFNWDVVSQVKNGHWEFGSLKHPKKLHSVAPTKTVIRDNEIKGSEQRGIALS